MDAAAETLSLLGLQTKSPKRPSLSALRKAVERGLPPESLQFLKLHFPAQNRRGTSLTLLSTGDRVEGKRFSPEESAQLARLAYVLAVAHEVWGDWDGAVAFLEKPHPGLDGISPWSASETEWGAREVEAILRKIQFGLPA
jgi:putative toxin-antitoxin system antitoxin component (TIGR02293 family)